RALLERNEQVITLSRRPDPGHPLSARVRFARLQFEDADALAAALKGAHTLYNTYWIRFPRRGVTFSSAVANIRVLLRAAARAEVARLALEVAAGDEGLTIDAAGTETLSFEALVRLIARAVGSRARLVHAPPAVARALANLVATTHRDVMLTRQELTGLQQELL